MTQNKKKTLSLIAYEPNIPLRNHPERKSSTEMHLFAQSATENLLMPAIFIDKVQIDHTLEQQIFLYYKEAE